MKHSFELLGFNQIKESLKGYASTESAKRQIESLEPYLQEIKLRKNLQDTTLAKQMIEMWGNPPLPNMDGVEEYLERTVRGEILLAEEIEQIGAFLAAVKRVKQYLEKSKINANSLAYYDENLAELEAIRTNIETTIRGGKIDDYASNELHRIRKKIVILEEKIKSKAEGLLRSNKQYMSDNFIVNRNHRICLPVKAAYKKKIAGTVVDSSSTGTTLFIEPFEIGKLQDQYEQLKIEEDTEERRILYILMDEIANSEHEMRENIRVLIKLDFIFAKGKLSVDMEAIEPEINLERYLLLESARHPQIAKSECVPLDIEMGREHQGVIITGPNTGGKTVAIKTVGLLSLMACSGLHIPCKRANIAMNSQVLCDIGDGQNISNNLSTFSAHIKNMIHVLEQTNEESLVILDELGSGTDPTEGMGIAIAILEQLRLKKCLFLATTHYPEVKEYAKRHHELLNARMAFDKNSLKPLYRLEVGKAGDSCALYIARHLGLADEILRMAAVESYGEQSETIIKELGLTETNKNVSVKKSGPRVQKHVTVKKEAVHGTVFQRGDSVKVYPDEKIGIVVTPADRNGNVLVQMKKEKMLINHKRLKILVSATELYPEDYDFSIIFESVENRKKRHQMERKYQKDIVIEEFED